MVKKYKSSEATAHSDDTGSDTNLTTCPSSTLVTEYIKLIAH